jgi:hypothetical protein
VVLAWQADRHEVRLHRIEHRADVGESRSSGRLRLRLDPFAAPSGDRNQLGVRTAAEDPRVLAPPSTRPDHGDA